VLSERSDAVAECRVRRRRVVDERLRVGADVLDDALGPPAVINAAFANDILPVLVVGVVCPRQLNLGLGSRSQ